MAGTPLKLQADLLEKVNDASTSAQRAQAAYQLQRWNGARSHRMWFAVGLLACVTGLLPLRSSRDVFVGWDASRIALASVIEIGTALVLLGASVYVRVALKVALQSLACSSSAQVKFRQRHRLFAATCASFIILSFATFAFNVWSGASVGMLTMVVTLSIVCGIPAAFPMPLNFFLAATGTVCVIAIGFFLTDGVIHNRLPVSVANVFVFVSVTALTGKYEGATPFWTGI